MPFKRYFKFLFPFFALVLWSPSAPGRDLSLEFDRITQDHGLSNNAIRCLMQDRTGYLWVGTENGLNRYDGIRFTVFRNDPDNPRSISGNAIASLFEDRKGNIWIGTYRAGLNRFDPRQGDFQRFPADLTEPTLPNELPPTIYDMLEDEKGMLWLGCHKSLVRFDPQTGLATRFPKPQGNIKHVLIDQRGTFWVGDDFGLSIFNRATESFEPIRDYHVEDIQPYGVEAFCLHPDGRLFVGTALGVEVYDTVTRRPVGHYGADPKNPNSLGSDLVLGMALAGTDTLWVGTNKAGLNQIQLSTGEISRYRADGSIPKSYPGNNVRALYIDRTGILWVGDVSSGLSRFSSFTHRFQLWRNDPFNPNSLSDNYIRGICRDRAGKVWVATQFGGLNRLDPLTGTITRYRNDPARSDSLPSDNVWSVHEDRAGELWVGTSSGIGRFDPVRGSFRLFDIGIKNTLVQVITEDRAGRLWYFQNGSLVRVDPDRKGFHIYPARIIELVSRNDLTVQAITEDRFGELWLGCEDGVIRFDPNTERTRTYSAEKFQSRNTIGPFYATNFLEDRAGNFWVASKGGGLHRLDQATDEFTSFTVRDGLPDNNVYGLFEDARGNFWLSTDNGIARFDPRTRTVRTFSPADGLQGLEFNRRAFHQTPEGDIYFGGTNGLNSFKPDDIGENRAVPTIVIGGVETARQPVPIKGPAQPSVTLAFDDNTFTVTFAALDFNAPTKNRYAYRLEGVDSDWVPSLKPEAVYSKLPPGNYRFRVRGTNNDGIWSEREAVAQIRILPPWWRTWWAYTIYTLFGVALAFGAFGLQANRFALQSRLRETALRAEVAEAEQQFAIACVRAKDIETAALERENLQRARTEAALQAKNEELAEANDRLRELDRIKQQFTAMLVHDIKSPMSAVQSVLKLLEREELSLDEDMRELLHGSQENLGQVVSLVDEVLEVFKNEGQEIRLITIPVATKVLLNRCFQTASIHGMTKGVSIQTEIADNLPEIECDPGKLERVFGNLLSNAVKFTSPGGRIVLEAEAIEGTGVEKGIHLLIVKITDNGPGINAEDLPYIFDPYRQSTAGHQKVGFGLGLAIVRRIVAAHGGSVSVRSQIGVGSTFTVTLPTLPPDGQETA